MLQGVCIRDHLVFYGDVYISDCCVLQGVYISDRCVLQGVCISDYCVLQGVCISDCCVLQGVYISDHHQWHRLQADSAGEAG